MSTSIKGLGENKFNKFVELFSSCDPKKVNAYIRDNDQIINNITLNINDSHNQYEPTNTSVQNRIDMWKNRIVVPETDDEIKQKFSTKKIIKNNTNDNKTSNNYVKIVE